MRRQARRRALNAIWTAAGRYDFWPEFMAFFRDGQPDLYMNSIIGLVHRHYDAERLSRYMAELDRSLLRRIFTDLFWIGLEQAAYERELPFRPALPGLREEHARRFLEEEGDMDASMQQLMLRNETVHALKRARCREILGEPPGLGNPWDKRLYEALHFSGGMETEELIEGMEDVRRRFFVFRFTDIGRKPLHLAIGARAASLLRRLLPAGGREAGELDRVSASAAGAGRGGSGKGFHPLRQRTASEEELRRRFGPPLFSADRMAWLEQECCRGAHEGTRLWISGGPSGEREEAQEQNLSWYAAHRSQCRTALAKLREAIRNCLLVQRQPTRLPARSGTFQPGQVWRGIRLGDSRIFSAWEEEAHGAFSVMLLLDASQSRESQQETVACQAYLIAEGLQREGIPVGIASFCSWRGCTALQRMKSFSETDARAVFRYRADGWNRDGLALRASAELLREAPGKRLLLVLTDAYPSDDRDIPGHGFSGSKDYAQEPAVRDAAEAVRLLRRQGIRVIGIINSVFSDGIVEGYAQRIYGQDCARISRISQLAPLVGSLVEAQIREG